MRSKILREADILVLSLCVDILEVGTKVPEFVALMRSQKEWIRQFSDLAHGNIECVMVFTRFLVTFVSIYPWIVGDLIRDGVILLKRSRKARRDADMWAYVEMEVLTFFRWALVEPKTSISFLTVFVEGGTLLYVHKIMRKLSQPVQVRAMEVVMRCFGDTKTQRIRRGISQIIEGIDLRCYFKAIDSSNEGMRVAALCTLQAIVSYDGASVVPMVNRLGLPPIITRLCDTGSYSVKVATLELVQMIILRCTNDADRIQYVTHEFIDIIGAVIDDDELKMKSVAHTLLLSIRGVTKPEDPLYEHADSVLKESDLELAAIFNR